MRATSLLVIALLSFTSGIQIRSFAEPAAAPATPAEVPAATAAAPAAPAAPATPAAAPATDAAAPATPAADATATPAAGTAKGPAAGAAAATPKHTADEEWVANMNDKAMNRPHGALEYLNAQKALAAKN